MRLSTVIKFVLTVWIASEVLVFALIVDLIGLPLTVLIGFATTVGGYVLLRQAGASAMIKLRAALDGRRFDDRGSGRILDDTLATLGAIALLLPGFLSDVVGLALASPGLRGRVATWIDRGGLGRLNAHRRAGQPQHEPSTIDLSPEEWQRNDPSVRSAGRV